MGKVFPASGPQAMVITDIAAFQGGPAASHIGAFRKKCMLCRPSYGGLLKIVFSEKGPFQEEPYVLPILRMLWQPQTGQTAGSTPHTAFSSSAIVRFA